jgi:hypothetical protein
MLNSLVTRIRVRVVLATASAVLLVTGLAGCGDKEKALVYYTGPAMPAQEIDARVEALPTTGYEIVEEQRSVARFPGALAVARLAPPGPERIDDDGDRTQWRITTMPEEEATYWNALFNRVPRIREVIVLGAATVTWADADHREMNATAERLKADLCLIYGPSASPVDSAAYSGVILDYHAHPVAYLKAQAGPSDYETPHDDTFKEDLRHRDPEYLAARRFELQVRRCMDELIRRDQPPPATVPSEWRERALDQRERSLYIIPNRDLQW